MEMTEQTETLLDRKRVRRPAPEIWEDPDSILPFYVWAEKAGISERQAKRLRQTGQAPRCVRLGERALGVTLAEHRRWVKTRLEA
jgi:predicted DNA-binding transcriptional regulator AlpA